MSANSVCKKKRKKKKERFDDAMIKLSELNCTFENLAKMIYLTTCIPICLTLNFQM